MAILGNQVLWWFWREPTNPASLRHVSSLPLGSSQTRSASTKPLSTPHVRPPSGSSGLDRRRPLDGFGPPGPIKLARVLAVFMLGVDRPRLHAASAAQVPGHRSPSHGRRRISYAAAWSFSARLRLSKATLPTSVSSVYLHTQDQAITHLLGVHRSVHPYTPTLTIHLSFRSESPLTSQELTSYLSYYCFWCFLRLFFILSYFCFFYTAQVLLYYCSAFTLVFSSESRGWNETPVTPCNTPGVNHL